MNVQVNAKSAAKSVLEFVQKSGGNAKNTEALELVARICGFDSYRAMRAVSQRDEAPSKVVKQPLSTRLIEEPGRVAFRSPMIDWEWDENPNAGLEFIPERRRGKFEVVVEDFSPQFRISVRPVGIDLDNYHGKPVLDLQLEIDDGVPSIGISNDPAGEMLLKVYGAGAGLVVRQEEGENMRIGEAPTSLYELARRNGGEYLSDQRIWAVKNDTFAGRTHTDMLVTAIADDTAKAVQSTDSVKFLLPLSAPVTPPVDEAVADLSEAKDVTLRNSVIHVQFDDSVGDMQAWIDVCIVGPDGGSELADTTAGYTVFGKEPEDRPARRAFVDALAPVAAYFVCAEQYKYMRELIGELIVRPNALELVHKCQEIITKAYSVHGACDAIEAVLAVMPAGLVLAGGSEDCVVCRHCRRSFSLDDEGISLGMSCPSKSCPSHQHTSNGH
jgi:hypothetical protein